MNPVNRFVILSEKGWKLLFFSTKNPFISTYAVSLCLIFSFLNNPVTLLAEEKQPTNANHIELAKTADRFIEQMILKIDCQKENTTESTELAENPDPTSFFSSIPNIKPISGSITSTFGIRVHPIYNGSLFHSGIDISASEGTQVKSTGDGIVAFSGYDKGYGQKITINHGYGYKTIYAHLSKFLVSQGQKVKRGQIIALSGNTGVSIGAHLHYEVEKNNVKVNPADYFFDEIKHNKFITTQKNTQQQSDNNF